MVNKIQKYIVIVILLFSGILSAQTISVNATTDSADYQIGDYIKYMLEFQYTAGTELVIPSVKDSVNTLEFIKELPPVIAELGTKVSDVRTFIFSKYDSTEVTIPAFNIPYTVAGDTVPKFIRTNIVDLVVRSLEVDSEADIIDVKKPRRIGLDWIFIFIVALIIVVILAAAYFGYTYYKKKKAGEPIIKKVIKIPPDKLALKALYELEEQKLWQQGKIKDYHSDITGIVRKYFEDRFGVLALEITSSELLMELKKLSETTVIYDYTKEFLENADMVKFAKFEPMPSVNEEMMKQAKEIVYKTKPEETSEVVEEVKDV